MPLVTSGIKRRVLAKSIIRRSFLEGWKVPQSGVAEVR